MLLTISTTHTPATDLGYLLHKHPDRVQQFRQSCGTATVVSPEADESRCTAALLLDVDPVRLARSRSRHAPDFSLAQYVNDRSYAASSLLAVALGDVFGTARSGRCAARPDLAARAIALRIEVPVLPCRGGSELAHRLFGPLGWRVTARPLPLDERFASWGDSRYVALTLEGDVRLADALNQLYVLLPVLDESKHYWQASDEVDKLLRAGGAWLAAHPERELVTRRYLARSRDLTRAALTRLAELGDDVVEGPADDPANDPAHDPAVRPAAVPLRDLRRDAVLRALADVGARSVIDLGCGPGRLLTALLDEPRITRVGGADVSAAAVASAARRLSTERMGDRQAQAQEERLTLFQGALTYDDDRFAGYEAAVLMEVVEHVDPSRLPAVERVVFGRARPGAVVVTTPNADHNPAYPGLVGLRHPDHRFEWSRAEFAAWCERVAAAYSYAVELRGVGEPYDDLGPPTQLALFTRREPVAS